VAADRDQAGAAIAGGCVTKAPTMTLKDWRMLAIIGWIGWTFQYFVQYIK
jgi:hypothetical protein